MITAEMIKDWRKPGKAGSYKDILRPYNMTKIAKYVGFEKDIRYFYDIVNGIKEPDPELRYLLDSVIVGIAKHQNKLETK
jgi:hypothetical protein